MKIRKLFLICLILLLLTGCADNGNKTETTGAKTYDFIFVCPIIENEYWQECIEGIDRADAELGTNTTVIGPKTADNFTEEIVDYMKEAIAEKPDAIIVYSGLEALFPLIEEASIQGIPVFSIDSDAPDTSRVAYIGTDLYNLGYQSGEALEELTNGHAKIGYVCSDKSATSEKKVFNAFADAVGDYDMEVVAETEGHAEPDYAADAIKKLLQEHPEITAIFCTGGYNATGAAMAKEEQKRDDLILIGFDDVEENINFVRSGTINALFVQSPDEMGYQGISLMKEYIDKGELSQISYDTGNILVTQANVDTYLSSGASAVNTNKIVRVGYYSGDVNFQNGFSEAERKSGYAYEYYQHIASINGWQYQYIYGSREEIMDKLLAGDVDIVAGVYQTDFRNTQVLYPKRDMGLEGKKRYFVVSAGREDLLEELNYALEQIALFLPELTVGLKQKYYGQSTKQQILSESEREWLSQKGSLKIGFVRHNMPYSEQAEDGSPDGMVKDLIQRFSDYLKMEIEAVCYENIADMEKGLSRGEIDAAFPVYSDMWLAEYKGFRQTDAFVSDRVMVVYRGNYTEDLMDRVALSETGIGQKNYIDTYYPDAEIHFYSSRKEAFDAIMEGRENCIVGCSNILQRYLNEHTEYENMNIAYLDTSENFGMAVRQNDSILAGILNKALHHMDEAEFTSILMKYSAAGPDYSFIQVIRHYAVQVVCILVLFLTVILCMFAIYRRKSNLFNKEQAKTQAALAKALEESKIANAAKTNFISGMSHDIRTPMNAIIGMTAIAARYLDDKERLSDCLDKISVSSNHLLTLINNVLDISKIESGKLVFNPINFSLKDTMTSVVDIIRPQIESKGLDFDIRIHGVDYEMIYADEVRINQIFINILSNAVKYTPRGGRIIVDLKEEAVPDEKNVKLIYSVKDTGIGMSEEFMENMYDNFSRAKDSRIDKVQGTGLGLAIVKQIIDMMEGTITCESEENKGTQFVITLTVPIGERMEKELSLPNVKVLLVDDDEIFLESAGESLRDLGLLVDTASDGQTALDMIQKESEGNRDYAVFIVNYRLPGMDGLTTVQAIRKMVGEEAAVFLTSAYEWGEIEDCAADSGITGFLNKPIFRSGVYEKLKGILIQEEQGMDDTGSAENNLAGLHLLIAEDNDLNWEIIEELLDMYGISAERAENGQICVDMMGKAEAGTYDMILMDIQMPVMNGREAARTIRSHPAEYINSIPIIAMTADAFAEDIVASLEAGMDGHVSKPVDMDGLLQEMRKVLEKYHKL